MEELLEKIKNLKKTIHVLDETLTQKCFEIQKKEGDFKRRIVDMQIQIKTERMLLQTTIIKFKNMIVQEQESKKHLMYIISRKHKT